MNAPKTILVIDFGFIGDVINASSVCQTLKKHYPEATLVFATLPCSKTIAQCIPAVDEVVTCEKIRRFNHAVQLFRLAQAVKNNWAPDLAIVLENNTKSLTASLFAYLTGAPIRVGRSAGLRGLFLTQGVPYASEELAEQVHMSEMYQRTLQPLNLYSSSEPLCLEVPDSVQQRVDQRLQELCRRDEPTRLIGLCPWSRLTHKDWSIEEIGKFLKALQQEQPTSKVLLIGDKESAIKAKSLRSDYPGQLIDLTGKTSLEELIVLINKLDILVTVDTGPMHIAYALNKPTISLFFQNIFKRWGPKNAESHFEVLYTPDKSQMTAENVTTAVRAILALEKEVLRK